MAFPLAAIGAGLGQFAEQYQKQQQDYVRTLMLQMQLANFQREMDKDRRASTVADIVSGGVSGLGVPQQAPPIQGLPQPQIGGGGMMARPPQRQPQTQPGSAFEGQNTGYPFPTVGADRLASRGFPILPPNTTGDPGVPGPGYPSQIGSSTTAPVNLPPPRPGGDGSPIDRGFPATQTVPTSLTGTGAAQPGGTQVAQAGMPQPPELPPSRATIVQKIFATPQYRNLSPRVAREAAIEMEKNEQEIYKVKLQDYQAALERYKLGPLHQQQRGEKIEDLRVTSQIPAREGPKLMRGPGGRMMEWQPGTPLPDGGVGWTVAGTGEPSTGGRKEITLENGLTVTGTPGKKDWTTLTGEPLPPDMQKMLESGRVQRFGTAASQVDPSVVEGVARGIADYKMAPVTSWAMRSPFGQAVMAKVRELNPEYDQAKYNQRQRGLIAFTTGRQGDSVRSFNTSIDHLEVMDDAVRALINGDARLLNAVANYAQKQFGYNAPVDFNFVKNVVGGEISKAVIGGIGGVTDREEMRNGFELANSPEQLEGVIKRAKQLMAGQLASYRRQSEATGFPVKDFDAMLSPAAKQQLEVLYAPGTLGRPAAPAAGAAGAPAAGPLPGGRGTGRTLDDPSVPQSVDEVAKLPSGTYYVHPSDPDNVRRKK